MKQENVNKLLKNFPEVYGSKFRFGVGDGWFKLIYKLSQDITDLCRERGLEVPKAQQVKEKFGGLRFYVNGVSSDELHDIIYRAESESRKVCEQCGSTENVTAEPKDGFGWIRTLCAKCRIT